MGDAERTSVMHMTLIFSRPGFVDGFYRRVPFTSTGS